MIFLAVASIEVFLFILAILLVFLALILLFLGTLWLRRKPDSVSPYSKLPMRKGADIPLFSKIKVLRYLYHLKRYENRIFDLNRSAVCLQTGRIFPDCVNLFGKIRLDWRFLQKRYPGNYVSWGSLSDEQQELLRITHGSLEGFQTEYSSPDPVPKSIEATYAFTKPGPLYVDLETQVLLGWKEVPETDFEVMIVQVPKKYEEQILKHQAESIIKDENSND